MPGSEDLEIQSEIPHHVKDVLDQFFLVRSKLIVICIVCIG